jgi:hypothetical protein
VVGFFICGARLFAKRLSPHSPDFLHGLYYDMGKAALHVPPVWASASLIAVMWSRA